MASGIDDRLHGLWTRPGQTLRGRVNHRAREPPKTSSQRIAESCGNGNIIVIIMNLWNVASPLQRARNKSMEDPATGALQRSRTRVVGRAGPETFSQRCLLSVVHPKRNYDSRRQT